MRKQTTKQATDRGRGSETPYFQGVKNMCSVTNDTPRIYVACLASYNSGILHGRWIDCDVTADEIREEIAEMLAESKEPIAEEYAIHDCDFHGIRIGEYDDIDTIAELGQLIAEHGEPFALYADNVGIDDATADGFSDAYRGEWDSERAYAENYIDDCYNLDEMMGSLACYFDYDQFAHDLFMGDLYSIRGADGALHVFDR